MKPATPNWSPPPTGHWRGSTCIDTGNYTDPNNILGPQGFGVAQYVPISQSLGYSIQFENEPTATLPTPQVTITEHA